MYPATEPAHVRRKDKPIEAAFDGRFSVSQALDAAAAVYNGVSFTLLGLANGIVCVLVNLDFPWTHCLV
jgi:hypothetical protein